MHEKAKRPTMIAFWLAAVLLVTYLIALFVAGDFIIPVALALVGDPAHWLPTQVLGWASIVGLVFVTIWFRHDPLKLAIWQPRRPACARRQHHRHAEPGSSAR